MGIENIGFLLRVLIVLVGIYIVIFWMVCAWRAMRAHEKLASSAQELARDIPGRNINE